MYSLGFTIYPLLIAVYAKEKPKVVLAPNGMLQKPALEIKKHKKRIFLSVFKVLHLHKKILFHACSNEEYNSIRTVFGRKASIRLVNYFPTNTNVPLQSISKGKEHLKCLYVSRILPLKNLLFLLEALQPLSNKITLSIVGPIEDKCYWEECQRFIKYSPSNVTVKYLGAQPHNKLQSIYIQNHVFVLPSTTESFGQVIFDSLLYGRPVIISDRTPCRNLRDSGVGWDLSLQSMQSFTRAIEEASNWSQNEYDEISLKTWQYARNYLEGLNLREEYNGLFSFNNQ